MVSNARLDLPEPESPVMQTRLFRGHVGDHSSVRTHVRTRVALRSAGNGRGVKETAKKAALATLVSGGIVVLALALWQLKLLAALLFFAFILAAAMRPTVDKLAEGGVPRGVGIGIHYVVLIGMIAGFLWVVVPRAIDQVDDAVGNLPQTRSELGEEAERSTGIRHDILVGVQRRLEDLPSGEQLVDPAVEVTLTVFEVALGIFFVLASAAYWVF